MRGTKAKIEKDPCQNCRERHLKCDDKRPCEQCRRLDEDCIRETNKVKFRAGSSKKYDTVFEKDQVWLGQNNKKSNVQFVDQTQELERYYAGDEEPDGSSGSFGRSASTPPRGLPSPSENSSHSRHIEGSSTLVQSVSGRGSELPSTERLEPNSKRRKTDDGGHRPSSRPDDRPTSGHHWSPSISNPQSVSQLTPVPNHQEVFFLSPGYHTPTNALRTENGRLPDSAAAALPSAASGLLSPRVWKEHFFWPNEYTTTQCVCLMRHFISDIAPWFDICDPIRHFSLVVPQRARRCPPLLNAIFTTSARHLVHMLKYRNSDGIIEYEGIKLPNLTTRTAIEYHNACIAYLMELASDPEHVQDESLLAAAVILRYYEELDASLTGEDTEHFLHTFQVFINAQASATFSLPYDLENVWTFGSSETHLVPGTIASYHQSFRHAVFRMALRQEVTSAFLKQRSVQLPLDAWASQRSFDEADDSVWTDRLVLYCADVLQYCFGEEHMSGRTRMELWQELKSFGELWEVSKPLSFHHIQYQEPNRTEGYCFPRIWYMSGGHVLGMQHLDLARILLTVYDPGIPRLGPGSIAAGRRISTAVQEIVLRICGNAVSNRAMQPAQVTAHLAIAVCGEYFTNEDEQKSMIALLQELEVEHAWPTARTAADLKEAWSRSD